MRWRVLLFISLAVNVLLAAGWMLLTRRPMIVPAGLPGLTSASAAPTRTNLVVRRQFFSWQEVESPDYPTYIANLRDIGCPEQTIRDIIVADVNALYARKRATEVTLSDQQWWRSELDTNLLAAATAKLRALEAERRALLTRLLGPNWEGAEPVVLAAAVKRTPPAISLDGPVLGVLPPEVKQSLQNLAARSQERMQAYAEAQRQAGKPLDPVELTRLRQQTRAELAKLLSPQQLEEYLLRYSDNANTLRNELGQLKYFKVTPEEFRALFRARDQFDLQIQMLAGATDPNSVAQRKALESQRDNALKIAVGPARYAQYQSLHDAGYRDAYAAAQQAGQPGAASVLYEISRATTQEQDQIRANTNLTAEQRAIESKKAELEQLKANAQALGQNLPPEPPAPSKPPPSKTHVLAPGENASFLAHLYGVDPGALRTANPNLNFDKLKAGDSVSIPINLLQPVPYLPPQ
jgi:LysM repeat protein